MCLNIFIYIKEYCSGCFFSSRCEKSKLDSYEAQNYKNNNFKHINYLWKEKILYFFFGGGGIFFIILWNEEMTITNPQYGSNKHKCILVVKQIQFGLNVLLYTKNYFKPFKSKLCLYILVSMTLQLCDNFKSFIISDYCMPYNVTILL